MLNAEQKAAAKKLLDQRPPVIDNTRAIQDDKLRQQWYDQVCAEMTRVGITPAFPKKLQEFCDLAGVAD